MKALLLLGLGLALAAHGGCGDKKDAGNSTQPARSGSDARVVAKTTTQTYTAQELHKRYFGSTKPTQLFANKRVVVSGTLHIVRATRAFTFVFKAGPARQQISCVFRDGGTAVRDRKLGKNSEATVDCKVRGRLAMRVELDDCVLR